MSAVEVAGEKAEHIQRDENQLDHPQNDTAQKEIEKQQDKIEPKKELIEFIIAIAAVHKADEPIREFGF